MIQIQRNLHSLWLRFCFESVFALGQDPWDYTSPYQQMKYDQVLSLLPSSPIDQALELACAEGHFTVQLASHVGSLIAADISQIALARASKRCSQQKCDHVHFMHLDITKNELPRRFKLIVCSEVLYYVGSSNLQAVAQKLADALEVNGYLITTNDNRVEDTDQASLDWFRPLGGKAIAQTLAHTPSLQLLKEIRTPFYRTQLFQRQELANIASPDFCPEVINLTEAQSLVPDSGLLDAFSLAAIYNALVRIRKSFKSN